MVRGIKLTYPPSRIHGLFITYTQFRLLTTFIFKQLLYTHRQVGNVQAITSNHYIHAYRLTTQLWCNPLAFCLPLSDPFFASLPFPFTYLETLLGVIGSRPPWSRSIPNKLGGVAALAPRKIQPLSPFYPLPIPKSRPPGVFLS